MFLRPFALAVCRSALRRWFLRLGANDAPADADPLVNYKIKAVALFVRPDDSDLMPETFFCRPPSD